MKTVSYTLFAVIARPILATSAMRLRCHRACFEVKLSLWLQLFLISTSAFYLAIKGRWTDTWVLPRRYLSNVGRVVGRKDVRRGEGKERF